MPRRKISTMNMMTTPDRAGDYLVIVDTSEPVNTDGRNKRMTPNKLDAPDTNFYNLLPTASAVSVTDYILIYSEDVGGYRKITKTNFDTPGVASSSIGFIVNGSTTTLVGAISPNIWTFIMPTEVQTYVSTQIVNSYKHATVSDHSTTLYTFGGVTPGSIDTARCEKTVMATYVNSTDAAFSLPASGNTMSRSKVTSAKGYVVAGAGALANTSSVLTYATSTAALQASMYPLFAGRTGVGSAVDGGTKMIYESSLSHEWCKVTAATDIIVYLNFVPWTFTPYFGKNGNNYDIMGTSSVQYTGHGGIPAASVYYIIKIFMAIDISTTSNNLWITTPTALTWYGASAISDGVATGWSVGGSLAPYNDVCKLQFVTETPSLSVTTTIEGCCNASSCNDIGV